MLHPPKTQHQVGPAAAALALAAALAGCAAPPPTGPALEDFNVVLIVVDTLGAGHVGAWNPEAETTPRIDAFVATGARFARAYATAPWTQPSVASIFTGRLPSGHGVHNIRDVLAEGETTLAEQLAERGFRTRAAISHHLISAELGYAQGFESYDESAVGGHTGISAGTITDAAIRQIDELRDERFFLFAHYFDPHYFYHHHPAHDRTSGYGGKLAEVDDIWTVRELRPQLDTEDIAFLRGRHREEIAFVDAHVGRLLDHLDEARLTDSTIVVLVADHGEEFMEHGWIGHTRTLYDELLHVPLILRIPGMAAGWTVETPVSIADIAPTLLALSRRPPDSPDLDGRSLLPLLRDATARSTDVFAEVSFLPPSSRQQEKLAFKTALIAEGMKVIHDRRTDAWELYRLGAEPVERTNLATSEPELLAPLAERLQSWEATRHLPTQLTLQPPAGLDPTELERLRALGYVD